MRFILSQLCFDLFLFFSRWVNALIVISIFLLANPFAKAQEVVPDNLKPQMLEEQATDKKRNLKTNKKNQNQHSVKTVDKKIDSKKTGSRANKKATNQIGKTSTRSSLVEEIFSKYKNAKMVKLDVKKKVTSELLGKVQTYDGQIYLAQKLFRWDTETPDKSWLIFDGQNIWSIQFPPAELKAAPQIARMKLDKNTKKQILFSQLLNQEGVGKNFKVLKEDKKDTVTEVSLEPKTDELNIKNLKLKIENKRKELVVLSYEDDLGNSIEIEITKTNFMPSKQMGLFKYQPPKGAAITHL